MLTTLDRYVLRKLLATFLPTCLALGFVFFVGATFRMLQAEDLSLGQVTLALPWLVPFLLPYLLPLAWVISVSLVLGRMVADQEVLAFTSLGIPRRSLAWPAVLVAAPLSAFSLWLTSSLVPHCYQMRKEAARAVFQQFLSLGKGKHLSRVFEKEGFDIYVREYGDGGLRGVVLHYGVGRGGRGQAAQVVAARGSIGEGSGTDRLELTLEDVTITLQPAGDGRWASPPIRAHLERYVQAVELSGRRRIKAQDFSTADLRRELERDAARGLLAGAAGGVAAFKHANDDRGVEARVELALRAAVAMAPLLLTLLAAPLTFLLDAHTPLVPFAAGLAAASGLFFAPLLLGRSLGETTGHGAFVFLGCAVSLASAAALAWMAGRR